MPRATKFDLKTHQNVRSMFFKIDGTSTASILIGSNYAALTDNGTGDYTLELVYPGKRVLGVFLTPIEAIAYGEMDSDSDLNTIHIKFFDKDGSAIDCDFFCQVVVSDTEYED
jgi:hypothetical protein